MPSRKCAHQSLGHVLVVTHVQRCALHREPATGSRTTADTDLLEAVCVLPLGTYASGCQPQSVCMWQRRATTWDATTTPTRRHKVALARVSSSEADGRRHPEVDSIRATTQAGMAAPAPPQASQQAPQQQQPGVCSSSPSNRHPATHESQAQAAERGLQHAHTARERAASAERDIARRGRGHKLLVVCHCAERVWVVLAAARASSSAMLLPRRWARSIGHDCERGGGAAARFLAAHPTRHLRLVRCSVLRVALDAAVEAGRPVISKGSVARGAVSAASHQWRSPAGCCPPLTGACGRRLGHIGVEAERWGRVGWWQCETRADDMHLEARELHRRGERQHTRCGSTGASGGRTSSAGGTGA
jgi:hypothetical protein